MSRGTWEEIQGSSIVVCINCHSYFCISVNFNQTFDEQLEIK
jgi:hypothetical protein